MSKKNYALTSGAGLFYDDETGLKVLPGKVVGIDKSEAGSKTNQAIMSGGLVEVSETNSSKKETIKTDLPEDLPGRDAFITAGMNFEQVKTFDFEKDKVTGVGVRTVESLQAYLKK